MTLRVVVRPAPKDFADATGAHPRAPATRPREVALVCNRRTSLPSKRRRKGAHGNERASFRGDVSRRSVKMAPHCSRRLWTAPRKSPPA